MRLKFVFLFAIIDVCFTFRQPIPGLKTKYLYFSSADADTEFASTEASIRAVDNTELLPSTDSKNAKKSLKRVKISAREKTGFIYSDKDGEYDVPIIDSPMWYRVSVRKSSEKKISEHLKSLGEEVPRWQGVIHDTFYPTTSYVKFKGKNLELATKPMILGLVYIKTKMGPDIADDLEKATGNSHTRYFRFLYIKHTTKFTYYIRSILD